MGINDLTIRPATADDAGAIAMLHAASWRSAYRGMLDDDYLDGPVFDDRRAVWSHRFAEPAPNQHVIVAEAGTELAGFVCVYTDHDPQWGSFIDNLHAHPERRREGIGRRLMGAAATRCRQVASGSGLYLYVFGLNERARRFYEQLGATDAGSEPRVPAAGGSEEREIHRYVWRSLNDVRL